MNVFTLIRKACHLFFVLGTVHTFLPRISKNFVPFLFVEIKGPWENSSMEVASFSERMDVAEIKVVHDTLRFRLGAFGHIIEVFCVKHQTTALQNTRLKIVNGTHNVDSENLKASKLQYYSGRVIGHHKSRVLGYYRKSVFKGIIQTENFMLYIEPTPDNSSSAFNARLYTVLDRYIRLSKCMKKVPIAMPSHNQSHHSRKTKFLHRVCDIHVSVDPSFFQKMERDVYFTVHEIIHIITLTDLYFRQTDFDGDGINDNLGFAVGNITIYASVKNSKHKGLAKKYATDILNSFSQIPNSNCLAILFVHRQIGRLTAGYDRGMCDTGSDSNNAHNTLIVSSDILPRTNSLLVVWSAMRELASLFQTRNTCVPKDFNAAIKRVYWDTNFKYVFGTCLVKSMSFRLPERAHCMIKENPVCGNHRVDEGEECDCGPRATCKIFDPCCTPPGGQGEDKGCMVRRQLGCICSVHGDPQCCCSNCRPYEIERCRKRYSEYLHENTVSVKQ